MGLAAAVGLAALYHWPGMNVPVYYFTTRPAFVWFGMTAPFVLIGALGLRWRWFATICAAWLVCFGLCGEIMPLVRVVLPSGRGRFEEARQAFAASAEARPDEPRGMPLRVVTWNMCGGKLGGAEAVRELAAMEPDVVFIQEAYWGGGPDIRYEVRKNPILAAYHWVLCGKAAILSRFPAERVDQLDMNQWHGGAVRITPGPGLTFTAIVVHLPAPTLKTQILRGWGWRSLAKAASRSRADLEAVGRVVEYHLKEGPVLLGGDFNLPAHYADLHLATGPLRDCFAAAGRGWGGTAPARLPVMRVDLLWAPPDCIINYCAAASSAHSDHYPVMAELTLHMGATAGGP